MPNFTVAQKEAIADRGHDILVSASAGSGKTAVLVQRTIDEIVNGTDVDNLLIVTFTKAAAEEMKGRLKEGLTAQIPHESKKCRIYLRQQLTKIDTANISTIDAFCLDVIHRFYYAVNLNPSFSILTDDTQSLLLKERALKDVERSYLEKKDPSFIAFYNNFAGDRDVEQAHDLLLDLYDFAMTRPDYKKWLKNLPKNYLVPKNNLLSSKVWQRQIAPYLKQVITEIEEEADAFLNAVLMNSKELMKVKAELTTFSGHLVTFKNAVKNPKTYDNLRALLKDCLFNGHYRKSNKWSSDQLAFYQHYLRFKKATKEQIYQLYTSFFATEAKQQCQAMHMGQKLMQTISEVELAFIHHFGKLKREQNLLDYNDMEELAYQILSQDTSNSQLARRFYQKKFKEILVDEYQDINGLQEKIIELLKNKKNNHLFLVGDVKQSIYGFRQAEPRLFLKKYEIYGDKKSKGQKRILFSQNFRSTKPILQLVNQLFNPLLTKNFGGIDYRNEGQLSFGALYYQNQVNSLAQATELLFAKQIKKNKENKQKDQVSGIEMMIDRIQQFKKEGLQIFDPHLRQNGGLRPFHYSDIAILTRSRNDNLKIMQAFAKKGLPLYVTDAANYFQTFELTIVMDYLKIIDNPDQDIPLVAVLRSPIFNFKEKALARIRIHNKKVSFYNALLSYVQVADDLSRHVKRFLSQLGKFRDFAATHRISELIWSIYTKTNLLEIMTALPNGEQRRVNLEALYERAASYESAGFKGLYQFINFINRMRRNQKDLAQPLLSKEAGNAVKLMTIHGAKGLEFPIVFYLGLEHHFQLRDLKGNYIIDHDNVGITVKTREYRLDTLVKAITNINKRRQMLEEEARILYVALTRAKQKLILVADLPNLDKKIKEWEEQGSQKSLPLLTKLTARSPLNFLGPSFKLQQKIPIKLEDISLETDQGHSFLYVQDQAKEVEDDHEKEPTRTPLLPNNLLINTAEKLYQFKYPFADASKTTAYQAVSEIKQAFNDPLDHDLENAHLLSSTNRYLQPIDTKPAFLFKNKFTGAEIGTATHLILQYYDYRGSKDEENLNAEIKSLIKNKKLNPDIVPSIPKDEIEWFVKSQFVNKFHNHPASLKREVNFSSLLAAKNLFDHFSDPNAKILVHGTIDGYFIENDGIILFDYKTDHVDPNHKDLSIAKIKHKYLGQLRLYEQALNTFSTKKVKTKYLILLDARKIVAVN